MKKIILQRGKEKSLQRFHPWVFSGAIYKQDKNIENGDAVEIYNSENQYLATGHYHNSSTCVKVFSFKKVEPDAAFWKMRLEHAVALRRQLGLFDNPGTTIFRLVNGEGDYMPGLIADWFDGNLVLQFHSYGMYLLRDTFVQILREMFGEKLHSIYDKSVATLPEIPGFEPVDELLYGSFNDVLVKENGVPFHIDIIQGQKTGFFIDQRESRRLVRDFSAGRSVLNLFCYTGGFSLYALDGGAVCVDSVDISKKAIEYVETNIAEMGAEAMARHRSFAQNVFDFFEENRDARYDVIVLDPPAFAKHHKVKENGVKGYRSLNRKALQMVKNGGFLFTFSCSQAISKEDFQTIVFSAAAMEGKKVRVLRHLEAGPDHPVDIFHPEGSYLKGLLVYVE